MTIIIDAKNAVLGRLGSIVAKMLLNGENIIIINAEKAIVTGRKKEIKERFLEMRRRGNKYKGPFYPKHPDAIVRRTIRGMLPYKKAMGIAALRRLKVYVGSPSEGIEGIEITSIATKIIVSDFLRIEDISKEIGWNGK